MDLRKTQNCPRSVIEGSEDNMKRRKIDKSSPMTPKEVLLLERRLKMQATTTRLLSNKNRIDCSGTTHQIQNDLTIPILSSVSALGSISGTANESDTPALEATTPKGAAKDRKIVSNINQLRSDYVELQKVLACKFCNAKRFQYEAPAFCCCKGPEVHVARSNGDSASQAFVPPINGGFSPPSQEDPNDHDAKFYRRRPNTQERGSQFSSALSNHRSVDS